MTTISGRRGLAMLACSTAAAASLLLPSTAYAATLTVSDPVGDAVKFVGQDEESAPAPQAKAVDIVTTRVDYRNQVLVVRVSGVKAAKNVARVLRVKGGGQDQYFFAGLLGPGVEGDSGPCQGASSEVNKVTATYKIKIPARCFGTPDRVRVGAALLRSDAKRETTTLDEGLRDGFSDDGGDIKLSKAVKRG